MNAPLGYIMLTERDGAKARTQHKKIVTYTARDHDGSMVLTENGARDDVWEVRETPEQIDALIIADQQRGDA